MLKSRRVYEEGLTDSSRWAGIELRSDDIIISTPSKCGTTWAQMICALLIFGTDLPAPLTELSPWVDMRLRPLGELQERIAAQSHRRFLKTHTPLDGLPSAEGVTYVVVGRDPRDVAVSMDRHRANLNSSVIVSRMPLTSRDVPARPSSTAPKTQRERIMSWINDDEPPTKRLSSLRGMAWHLSDAWIRRDERNVMLLHYADLTDDLPGQMQKISGLLGMPIGDDRLATLAEAASLLSMRRHADELVPDEGIGLLRDKAEFFGRGSSGQWKDLLSEHDEAAYQRRVRELVAPDLNTWMHR